MAVYSFDIVSEYDLAELNNVYDQTQREITSRYDFKNTPAAIEWLSSEKTGIKITGNGEWQIETILDIVRKKLAARQQSQKILDISESFHESNMKTTKDVPFKHGLDQLKAKKITSQIRDSFPKAKTQIQGDSIRVSSNNKDELQGIIQMLRAADFDFPLHFNNYR